VGLSGLDGRIFEGKRKDTLRVRIDGKRMVLRDDWTGTVEKINSRSAATAARGNGYLPVLTPPASVRPGRGDQR
jgi:acetylglutamate/LysW-gamma-L-alpha-aminoadipate kinase